MKHLATILLFLLALTAAKAEHLVLAVSEDDIEVTANFNGASVALMGAIERDAQTVARRSGYDVVVVFRGPSEQLVARRAGRTAGIWFNREAVYFPGAPSLYLMVANRPLSLIAEGPVLDKHEIGLAGIALKPLRHISQADSVAFREAAIRLKQDAGLYAEFSSGVSMLSETLFRARIDLPASVSTGRYEATVYLFSDGALLSQETAAFYVGKTGFEAFVSDLARTEALLYGLLAVALAVLTGWLGGIIFRRD